MRAVTRKEDLELWTGGRKEKVYEVRRKQQDFSQAAFQTDHTGISGTVFAVSVSGWLHDRKKCSGGDCDSGSYSSVLCDLADQVRACI